MSVSDRLRNKLEAEGDGDMIYDQYLDADDAGRICFFTLDQLPKQVRVACELLESNYQVIRDEILKVDEKNLQEWVEKEIYTKGWMVLPLYSQSVAFHHNISLCPKTVAVIHQLGSIVNVASVGFSYLYPGAHILPHNGYVGYSDNIIRIHLPLVVPQGICGLQVGNVKRKFTEGKCLMFNDSVTHQAWNFTKQTRIVLIIDIERGEKQLNLETYKVAASRLTN